jgi:F-type H+-transporting ATPase subunit b
MAAITEVKNEIGLLSVAVAEKILRNQLSQDSAQDAYVKKLTEEIKMN